MKKIRLHLDIRISAGFERQTTHRGELGSGDDGDDEVDDVEVDKGVEGIETEAEAFMLDEKESGEKRAPEGERAEEEGEERGERGEKGDDGEDKSSALVNSKNTSNS